MVQIEFRMNVGAFLLVLVILGSLVTALYLTSAKA